MPRRSRAHAYLLLARVSNLPTVWTNVLAGVVVSFPYFSSSIPVMPVIVSVSLFYMGGMFLNDAFDAGFDAKARPDRPIPAGDVSRNEVFIAGGLLMAIGEGVLLWTDHPLPAMLWGLVLAAAIVYYDYQHKGNPFGPAVMGLCRALVYFVAAAATVGIPSVFVVLIAAVMWVYVVALTWVAKRPHLGYDVAWLLAGICLVDAVFLVVLGAPSLALIAAAGFPLTLALQRVVPGT